MFESLFLKTFLKRSQQFIFTVAKNLFLTIPCDPSLLIAQVMDVRQRKATIISYCRHYCVLTRLLAPPTSNLLSAKAFGLFGLGDAGWATVAFSFSGGLVHICRLFWWYSQCNIITGKHCIRYVLWFNVSLSSCVLLPPNKSLDAASSHQRTGLLLIIHWCSCSGGSHQSDPVACWP